MKEYKAELTLPVKNSPQAARNLSLFCNKAQNMLEIVRSTSGAYEGNSIRVRIEIECVEGE